MILDKTDRNCVFVGCGVLAVGVAYFLMTSVMWELTSAFDSFWGPWALTASAQQSLQSGDYNAALRFADRAVDCSPNFEITYYTRAHVLEARGAFYESIEDYKRAVSLGHNLALADQGRVYEKLQQFEKAINCYCEALQDKRIGVNLPTRVRTVASCRALQPGEYNTDRHPDALQSLLTFFEDGIEREPENLNLKKCRDAVLQNQMQR